MADPRSVSPLQKLVEVAGHDLRNPLSVILVNAAVMARSGPIDDGRRIKSATRILSNVGRMNRMIGDLLDFTFMKIGIPLPHHLAELNLGNLAAKAVDELHVSTPARTVALELSGDLSGRWDQDRLLRALQTVLATAHKFGTPSEPLRMSCVDRTDHGVVEVTVEVAENPALVGHLLRLFQNVEAGDEIDQDGQWIALAVLRRTIAAHQGTLEVVSSPADGVRIAARLPRQAANGGSTVP